MSAPQPPANFLTDTHQYAVHFTDSQQRQVYVLSGTVILDPPLHGPTDGSRWLRGTTSFDVPVPDLPSGQWLVIEQVAPLVVLAAIQNNNVANNAGWTIDDIITGPSEGQPVHSVNLAFNYAVGDSDGYLNRVGYTVTLLGYYAPAPIIESK